MAILRRLSLFLAALIVAAGIGWILIGPEWRALLAHQPYGRDILFWNQAQRDAGFRMIDRIPFVIEAHEIEAGNEVRELPEGDPLDTGIDLDAYLAANRTAGIVILHNGKIRLERYEMGFWPDGRWTSFSVAKSLTSTLVGAAVKDGAIKSLDDPVSDYIDELKGSAYDGVTVEQVLTMTSGIDWNEDYSDPASDVARFDLQEVEPGKSALAAYMAGLGRAHPAGEVWNYSTGEDKPDRCAGQPGNRPGTGRLPLRKDLGPLWDGTGRDVAAWP